MVTESLPTLNFEYVENVPWKESPAFAFSDDAQDYLNAFKNQVDLIPTKDLKISFDEDIWDFNPYFKDAHRKELKFIFTGLPEELAKYCKFFVLHKISGKTKIPTVYVRFSQFSSIILNIFEKTCHDDISIVTTEDINNEINRRNASPSTIHNLYQAVYQMYYFLIKHYKLDLPVDLDALDEKSLKWKKVDKLTDTKLPDIPEKYYDAILAKALSVMRNEEINTDDRMMSAAIVFISQTGLRLGDFLVLRTNSLHTRKLIKQKVTTNFIHFTSKKPSRAHQPLLEFDVFCNSLATEAFNLMKKLRKNSELSKGNDILFKLCKANRKITQVAHTRERFKSVYKSFFYKYLPTESTTEWEGITPCVYHHNPKKEKEGTSDPVTLYIPDTRQFRVHVCTVLYNNNISLTYIQKYMGHLSESMMGYYVRPKDTYQENIQYSEQVIRNIVEEDATPLGGNMLGDKLKQNIKQFISDNNFNVQTDMEEIIKAFGSDLIIRGKTGGVCIKSSLRPCNKDARTNEIMCAYGLCPNMFHFYYMIDITYLNFKTMQKTYSAMEKMNQTRASQKELSKIKDLINRRLLPELDELDKAIKKNGFNVILDRHPTLLDIINNRVDIRQEAELWRTKH